MASSGTSSVTSSDSSVPPEVESSLQAQKQFNIQMMEMEIQVDNEKSRNEQYKQASQILTRS